MNDAPGTGIHGSHLRTHGKRLGVWNVTGARPHIDICIASFKRPHRLRTLLESLVAQDTHGRFSTRIIVVDNDANRSAEDVVATFRAQGVDIVYDVEPQQNISLARNRSFAHASGDFIATIDDDEYANREWLATLCGTLTHCAADVVFGPSVAVFESDARDYIKRCGAFRLPNPPTGSTERYVCHTGNVLLRRAVIAAIPGPFDPALGLTGCEDTALFEHLRRQGHTLVWCREAVVFASVPRERATLRWIAERAFRSGNMCHPALHTGPFGPGLPKRTELAYAGKDIVRHVGGIVWYLSAALSNRDYLTHATKRLRRIAYMLGLCAYHLNFHYEAYRER